MEQIVTKKKYIHKSLFFFLLICLFTLFLGIGYAQITEIELNVEGTAKMNKQTEVFISDVVYKNNYNANVDSSKINTYYQTLLDSTVSLGSSSDSTITYEITIINLSDTAKKYSETVYDSLFYDNNNITFQLNGLDTNTILQTGESVTFTITFQYSGSDTSQNILNSYLNFHFEDYAVLRTTSLWNTGANFNTKMKNLGGAAANITSIEKADEDTYNSIKDSLTDDNVISLPSSEEKTYMWFDNGKIYYYTAADVCYLNADSSSLFNGLNKVTYIDTSLMDTSNVTTMQNMFKDCNALTTIDFSHFDTSKVLNMNSMFWGSSSMTEFNLSRFDTSQVTNMYGMFYNCQKVTSYNLSSFHVEKVQNMASVFGNNKALTNLDLSSFVTTSATAMNDIFNGSNKIQTLNISNFDRTFASMESLEELDISSFSFTSTTSAKNMFSNMLKIKKIYVSNSIDATNIGSSSNMFHNCPLLVGGNGTSFATNGIKDKSFAVIDTEETPGYFTLKGE